MLGKKILFKLRIIKKNLSNMIGIMEFFFSSCQTQMKPARKSC